MEPKIVIPLGMSGSGKGTQAKFLCGKFGLDCISTGDLLRARKTTHDYTGTKIGETIDRGQFVPNVIVIKLLMDRWESLKSKKDFKGFVLDGAPRKLPEAKLTDEALEWYGWGAYCIVLLLDISEKEAMVRLLNRRICKECEGVIPFMGEFKKLNKCGECDGALVTREDDTEAAIKNRIAEFKEKVLPVIAYYEEQGRLIRINGEQSIEDVHKDIVKAITRGVLDK
jgi:adenylate kinase